MYLPLAQMIVCEYHYRKAKWCVTADALRTCDKVRAAGVMISHIVFEALIKYYMYRIAPAKFRFITCPPASVAD